jgi:hypothetical protein
MRADDLRCGLAELAAAEPVDSGTALAALRRRARARRARRVVAGAAATVALVAGAVAAVDPGDDAAPADAVDIGHPPTTAPVEPEPATTATTVAATSETTETTVAPMEPTTASGWAPTPGAWTALPPSLLGPREFASAVWTGEEVLVIGGTDGPPCPLLADCSALEPPRLDGAAFDPATGTWRSIAPVPRPSGWFVSQPVTEGGVVYVVAHPPPVEVDRHHELLAYSPAHDRWDTVAPPPDGFASTATLVAGDGRLVLSPYSFESGVLPEIVLDLATGTWSELPPDPIGESYDRDVVVIDGAIVLIAIPARADSDLGPGLYHAAVLRAGSTQWEQLPTSEVVGYWNAWSDVGGLVVNPTVGSTDGGAVNGWGRTYPFGGALDPTTGTWSDLPPAPADRPARWAEPIGGERYALSPGGLVLDTATWTWSVLPELPVPLTEGPAVTWADDALFVWGGAWFPEELRGELRGDGWIWIPA